MTTLKDLNTLSGRIMAARAESERHKRLMDLLCRARTSELTLNVWMAQNPWHKEVIELVSGAINEFAPEMLRVLELRQEAMARKHSAEAALMRAQLAALVDEEEQAS